MCWSSLESFDGFYRSIELAHNIHKDLVQGDELPFIELEEPLEPKVSIEEIILQPKIEPTENEIEVTLVDPVDEKVDTLFVAPKRKTKITTEFEVLVNKKKEKGKPQPKRKSKNEKPEVKVSISPTRRSARHHKEEIKIEQVEESENQDIIDSAEANQDEQSEDEYEPADDGYDPSSNSETEEIEEEFERKKVKTERKSNDFEDGESSKPKRKYKKLTPEEKEAKKNKTSSKQMKICAEWDQFLADFGFVFKCKICDYIGKDFRDLKGHFRVVHDKPRGYAMCCDRIFYKKEVLVEHIQFHINPEHFKCNNCGMTFKASKSLEYHSIHTCKSE